MSDADLLLLADVILFVHVLIALYNALGLPVIWIGALCRWSFVRNPWFRYSHAGLMGFVLVEALLGMLCPLTVWEGRLRQAAGRRGPGEEGFIAYWLDRILYHDFEPETFMVAYGLFYAAILATLFIVPVRPIRRKKLPPGENG